MLFVDNRHGRLIHWCRIDGYLRRYRFKFPSKRICSYGVFSQKIISVGIIYSDGFFYGRSFSLLFPIYLVVYAYWGVPYQHLQEKGGKINM